MTVDLPTAVPTSRSLPTATPAPTLTPVPPSPTPTVEPRPLVERISEEALFETLRDLAEIRSYRGWRSAGSPGETEALDYLTRRLAEMPRLQDMGLTVAREAVPIYLANLVHDVRLVLHVGDRDVAVPAQAPWGHIDNAARAAQFDTDGRVGDVQPDPLTASGPARAILTVDDLAARGDVSGQVLLVNYVLVDQVICGSDTARERAMALRNARPAAIVLVTTYGEQAGQSTGLYALDRPALTQVDAARVPVVTVRLEDLAELGVASLADLAQVRSAQLTVDVDIV
ncbi:MAG: hypothetical protein KJ734_15285, partial [Chloroflexi bacterium]|nr:hypothetical protein [Chloroflexota bacterium]